MSSINFEKLPRRNLAEIEKITLQEFLCFGIIKIENIKEVEIFKIVRVDNFGRESVADKLIAENVNEFYGSKIVTLLNEQAGEHSSDFFILVEDSYKLWKGMEELI